MKNTAKRDFTDNIIFDNILGIMCFGIFAAGVMYSNSRALPDTPRVALVEQTQQSLEPSLALLKQGDMQNDFSVREFRVVVR